MGMSFATLRACFHRFQYSRCDSGLPEPECSILQKSSLFGELSNRKSHSAEQAIPVTFWTRYDLSDFGQGFVAALGKHFLEKCGEGRCALFLRAYLLCSAACFMRYIIPSPLAASKKRTAAFS